MLVITFLFACKIKYFWVIHPAVSWTNEFLQWWSPQSQRLPNVFFSLKVTKKWKNCSRSTLWICIILLHTKYETCWNGSTFHFRQTLNWIPIFISIILHQQQKVWNWFILTLYDSFALLLFESKGKTTYPVFFLTFEWYVYLFQYS